MRVLALLCLVGALFGDLYCFSVGPVKRLSKASSSPAQIYRPAQTPNQKTLYADGVASALIASVSLATLAAASRRGRCRRQLVARAAGESLENSITSLFGAIYGIIALPFGGLGNCAVVQEGCVGVVQRFGKYKRLLAPGRHLFNIAAERVRVVPLKMMTMDVRPQTVITKDNLTVRIDALCFYRVEDAVNALFAVDDYKYSLGALVQVTMRTVLGENTLDELFSQRKKINERITELISKNATPWGINVGQVELKEVEIPAEMQRALAAVVEARQEAEAKLIQAKAQRESASILAEAASRMAGDPAALQLQWFETLRIIATQGKNATIIVPDRIDPQNALRVVTQNSEK